MAALPILLTVVVIRLILHLILLELLSKDSLDKLNEDVQDAIDYVLWILFSLDELDWVVGNRELDKLSIRLHLLHPENVQKNIISFILDVLELDAEDVFNRDPSLLAHHK